MEIKVYTVIDSSYRYGDLNSSNVIKFQEKGDRDKYYNYLLRSYKDNDGLVDDLDDKNDNEILFNDKLGKWSYQIKKSTEVIKVCSSISEDMTLNY